MTATPLLASLPPGARILIIRLRSIGDIVLLTPALRLLKEWRPDFQISVLIEARFRELLEGNSDVDEILTLDQRSGLRAVAPRLRLLRELRQRKFSACINLHGGPTSTMLTRASGASCKVGFRHFRKRAIYNVLVPDARELLAKSSIHTAEHQAAALFHLGVPQQEVPPARLFVSAAREAWWQEKRASLGLHPGRDYAILHPGALYATKQWPPKNFARLGAYLDRQVDLATVYACGPGESGLLEAIDRTAAAPIRRLENTGLGEFAAALAGARLFVGNDSGPAHMAAALARPTVVIFGSSSSQIWGPWPPASQYCPARVVQNFFACNPCPGDRCYAFDRPECILSVSFEQVRSTVEAVLKVSGQKLVAARRQSEG